MEPDKSTEEPSEESKPVLTQQLREPPGHAGCSHRGMAGRHRNSPGSWWEGTQGWGGCTSQKHLQQRRSCVRCDSAPEQHSYPAIGTGTASSDPAWVTPETARHSEEGLVYFTAFHRKLKN